MEDIDHPRERPGAADRILACLEAHGFEWDGEVLRQRTRVEEHLAAIGSLTKRGLTFECSCSRRGLSENARYPGFCRVRPRQASIETATRLRVEPGPPIEFVDRIQGRYRQSVAAACGDFVIRRRDGIVAYHLAVVVDDALQGITDVVRGADLLEATPRQILLQETLGLATPRYAHVPVLTEHDGSKLSKSARSVPVDAGNAAANLARVFALLGMEVPTGLDGGTAAEAWAWGIAHWRCERIPARTSQSCAPLMR